MNQVCSASTFCLPGPLSDNRVTGTCVDLLAADFYPITPLVSLPRCYYYSFFLFTVYVFTVSLALYWYSISHDAMGHRDSRCFTLTSPPASISPVDKQAATADRWQRKVLKIICTTAQSQETTGEETRVWLVWTIAKKQSLNNITTNRKKKDRLEWEHTHTRARAHARTHARTHAHHTHTPLSSQTDIICSV